MRTRILTGLVVCSLMTAMPLLAQTPTGIISGRVVDQSGGVLPGVTVNAESPALQGIRTVVSTENGDYLIPLLPPGDYTVSFELSGFQTLTRMTGVAGTQTVHLDVTMAVGALAETVNVIGNVTPFVETAQVATKFDQDLIATLPSTRDLNAAVLMAPAVHPTGPSGGYSIAGSMSFENLFTVNGVVVNENIRGQPNSLFIEDAVQEVTVATAGVSAEYGRFSGGVVNAITKSGGNNYSGSFRTTFINDNWRSTLGSDQLSRFVTPFTDTKLNRTVPTYEFTAGGPVLKDRLWFFGAGRLQEQQESRTTNTTNISYARTVDERRYEGKLTYSANSNHTVKGSYTKIFDDRTNDSFGTTAMDQASLYNRSVPQDLLSLHYTGILTPTFFLEGQYSARHLLIDGSGSPFTDLIKGTLVIDRARGNTRYWSPTFCGVCGGEERDNNDVVIKGSYFLSTSSRGSHNLVFGYDGFNDIRRVDNHQSGSDYRILGTRTIIQGTTITPVFLGDNSTRIQYNPIDLSSQGTNFRTHSLFVNDNWRYASKLSFNLGLRWDKNDGKDAAGNIVANDSVFSPRLGVIWDPLGDGRWSVTGSLARYTAAIANSIADVSPAGNPHSLVWAYQGPSINADPAGPLVTTDVALQRVFDWFFANGGTSRPFVVPGIEVASYSGLNTKILDTLRSPNVMEYAGGVARQLGARGSLRVDTVFRDYQDFYSNRTDTSTGQVSDPLGRPLDLTLVENTSDLKRRYAGMTAQATYRWGPQLDLGGNYTLSKTWGNLDGENTTSGPILALIDSYPEYRQASWNYPEGDLLVDQRHRVRLWGTYTPPIGDGAGSFNISVLEQMGSGTPYGAVGPINSAPYVTNPGYISPVGGRADNAWDYFFTTRDAFKTEATYRTDLAVNYSYRIPSAGTTEVFFHGEVLNLFNQFQLCACGGSVFTNGGATDLTRIGQSVLTNSNSAAANQAFNPFTTTPVEGVNWRKGANFGTPLNRFAYTSPRTFRFNVGVRF